MFAQFRVYLVESIEVALDELNVFEAVEYGVLTFESNVFLS